MSKKGNTHYIQLQQEEVNELKKFVQPEQIPLIQFIFESDVTTVDVITNKFPELFEEMEALQVIGKINGKLFKKFQCAIYPIEVNGSIGDSVYAIGRMVDV